MVRIITQIFRFFIPWLLRVIWFTLLLIGNSIVSMWKGVPKLVKRISNNLLDRAVAAGFPTEWDRPFYFAACIAAFLTILAGWILTSFLTVLIVRWIIRL
jgi:hypothetical protein